MGDRASVVFVDSAGRRSVAVFSHWGGQGFFSEAKRYLKDLAKRQNAYGNANPRMSTPMTRGDCDYAVADFLRWHFSERTSRREKSSFRASLSDVETLDYDYSDVYLGATEGDGDNSDNGNMDLKVPHYKA